MLWHMLRVGVGKTFGLRGGLGQRQENIANKFDKIMQNSKKKVAGWLRVRPNPHFLRVRTNPRRPLAQLGPHDLMRTRVNHRAFRMFNALSRETCPEASGINLSQLFFTLLLLPTTFFLCSGKWNVVQP